VKIRYIALALIVLLLIKMDASINFVASYSDPIDEAIVYGYKSPPRIWLNLRDITSALKDLGIATLYLYGGVPKVFHYRESEKSIAAYIDIVVNDINITNIGTRYFNIRYNGYLSKATLYSNEISIAIYTVSIYTMKTFYISLCPEIKLGVGKIDVEIKFNEIPKDIDVGGDNVKVYIDDVLFQFYTIESFDMYVELSEKGFKASTHLFSGQCLNFLVGISQQDLKRVKENISYFMEISKESFKSISSLFPMIYTRHFNVKNLYLLSLYSTLNKMSRNGLEDYFIGVKPQELSSLAYLLQFSNNLDLWRYLLNNIDEDDLKYEDAPFYIDIIYYYTIYRGGIDYNINYIYMLFDMLNQYSYNAIQGFKAIDIARALNAFQKLRTIALLTGNRSLVNIVDSYLNRTSQFLSNLYPSHQCIYLEYSEIEKNFLEAIAFAAYSISNADRYIDSCISLLNIVGVDRVDISEEYIADAIEALARNRYHHIALELIIRYIDKLMYIGDNVRDIYKAILKGFLGLDTTPNYISIEPRIPIELTNISIALYIADRKIYIDVIGWGNSATEIYLDNNLFPQTTIPIKQMIDVERIFIVMDKEPLTPLTVTVLSRGMPLSNASITIYNIEGFKASAITDSFGAAKFLIPCKESWVYITVDSGKTTAIKINTLNCNEMDIVLDLDVAYSKDNYEENSKKFVEDVMNSFSRNISNIEKRLLVLERYVYNVSQDLNSLKEFNENIRKGFTDINRIIYILLTVSIISLACSVLAFGRRK
jgi:hypothetical protein